MSWIIRGLSYCGQIPARVFRHFGQQPAYDKLEEHILISPVGNCVLNISSVRHKCLGPPQKFVAQSPHRKPGPGRYGYQQKFFDGGPLPRGLVEPVQYLERYQPKDVWSKKKVMFGRNDYIDILGDSDMRPVDFIHAPSWLKGFNGNELQRLVRMMSAQGHVLKQLYPTFYHHSWKRIKFLYKKYNQKRGKRHT